MKFTLVLAFVLAAAANVAAQAPVDNSPAIVDAFPRALQSATNGTVVTSDAGLVDAINDFQTVLAMGIQDVKTLTNLVQLAQGIVNNGLTADNGPQFLAAVQGAIQSGMVQVQEGKDLSANILAIVKNIQTNGPQAIADLKKAFQGSMKPISTQDFISDLQKVIQNGSKDAATTAALVKLIQAIQKDGLNAQNGQELLKSIETALSTGILHLKDGADLIGDIKNVIKNGMSIKDGALVADAISKALQAALAPFDPNPKICRRKGLGRTAGKPLQNQCLEGEEAWGALCYPKCKEGYKNFGCCLCQKKGNVAGPSVYGRGAGKSRLGCGAGKDKDGLFCYPQCQAKYNGVGPMCWPECPKDAPFKCGLFCSSSAASCFSQSIEIAGAGIKVILGLVDKDYKGAADNAIGEGGKLISISQCPAPQA
ncbi:Aste57867_9543 [Aphanomyces stellatus]|uniref:Aste57867_9543 protein n=1 Tax=Aphanomyces stellatus TaxID=120398 RepID=A0A485KNL5_9STRA|nr:hypothetical protein As57867_009506 [Aphanomyces stellatus]VFT86422.1 Aste57867_9543 [Aphanomyces stellatus]